MDVPCIMGLSVAGFLFGISVLIYAFTGEIIIPLGPGGPYFDLSPPPPPPSE